MYWQTFLHILTIPLPAAQLSLKFQIWEKWDLVSLFGKYSGLRRFVSKYSLKFGHVADDTVVWRRFSPSKYWKCWQHKVNEHREVYCTGRITWSQGQEYWNCIKSYNTVFKNQWQFSKGWRQSFNEMTNFNFILKKIS